MIDEAAHPQVPGESGAGADDGGDGQLDAYAAAIVDARLGRPARDLLEATVVLEAWSGRSASAAMTAARGLIDLDGPPLKSTSKVDPTEDREQQSVLAEGITLVLLILSVAAWATPIRRQLGPGVLSHAILFRPPDRDRAAVDVAQPLPQPTPRAVVSGAGRLGLLRAAAGVDRGAFGPDPVVGPDGRDPGTHLGRRNGPDPPWLGPHICRGAGRGDDRARRRTPRSTSCSAR